MIGLRKLQNLAHNSFKPRKTIEYILIDGIYRIFSRLSAMTDQLYYSCSTLSTTKRPITKKYARDPKACKI